MNPQKIQGSSTTIKFLGVISSGMMHAVPEAMTDKVQAYSTPKNMKEVQALVGILEFGGFLFSMWHSVSIPYISC